MTGGRFPELCGGPDSEPPIIAAEALSRKSRLAALLDHVAEVGGSARRAADPGSAAGELLLLVVCGTFADCDDCEDVAAWGAAHLGFLRQPPAPPEHGVPGERWLTILMNRINPGLWPRTDGATGGSKPTPISTTAMDPSRSAAPPSFASSAGSTAPAASRATAPAWLRLLRPRRDGWRRRARRAPRRDTQVPREGRWTGPRRPRRYPRLTPVTWIPDFSRLLQQSGSNRPGGVKDLKGGAADEPNDPPDRGAGDFPPG